MEQARVPVEPLRVGGDEIRFRVTSAETAGALLAADVRMAAGGGPPLLHRHEPAEVYRVEEGELAIYLEDDDGAIRRHRTRAGDVVHIPARRAHTIRNESDAAARAFVLFTPGAAMEAFVRGAAGLDRPEEVVALAERHGMTFAGPVPAGA
jgi:oxalate decarboxylase/phosphoglucose isomerase-like protein (cupin superfamily)